MLHSTASPMPSLLPIPRIVAPLISGAMALLSSSLCIAQTPRPSPTPEVYQGPTARWISSTEKSPWQEKTPVPFKSESDGFPLEISLRLDHPAQQILGWGGCFNELGWKAMSILPETERAGIMRDLFDPKTGLGFTICRMPLGSSDYADGYYSLDDSDGDFGMEHFSLKRDEGCLIPYIKAARAVAPNLQVWASPWTPPEWMKRNKHYGSGGSGGTNEFIQEPKYLSAYAKYFAKAVTEFRKEGVPLMAVAVQNEPFYGPKYPSCRWTPEEMGRFIGDYLAPEFRANKIPAEIWFGTMNNGNPDVFSPVLDSPAGKDVDAVGLQWAGKLAIPELNRKYPSLKKVQTESECGNGSMSWEAAERTFDLIRHYLSHGVSIYDYWNMVLDETGMSHWGWRQNALIAVNQKDASVKLTPEYWLMKHFSHFVTPGSVLIPCEGVFQDALAFTRPDGSLVVVAANMRAYDRMLNAKIGKKAIRANLPARSFNTFVIDAAKAMM